MEKVEQDTGTARLPKGKRNGYFIRMGFWATFY